MRSVASTIVKPAGRKSDLKHNIVLSSLCCHFKSIHDDWAFGILHCSPAYCFCHPPEFQEISRETKCLGFHISVNIHGGGFVCVFTWNRPV